MKPAVRLSVIALLIAPAAIYLAACHSYHIETTVTNNTGGAVSLLEVDYPSASFGTDALTAGADLHHRIQTRGSGPLKVQYTGSDGKQLQVNGPVLYEQQQGRIEIVLMPNGKVDFHPYLDPKH